MRGPHPRPGPEESTPQVEPAPGLPSRLALVVLVALVVLAPWPYGAAHPRAVQAVAVIALAIALAAWLFAGRSPRVPFPAWPLAALLGLALLQIVPLPRAVLALVAPGPAAVWHPAIPAAASVLGPGAHPVSVDPDATRRWIAFTTGVVALGLVCVPPLRTRRRALAAALAVIAGALLVALYGVVARTLFGSLLFGTMAVPTIAPFGSFVSKNHFAGYVEMAALLGAGLTWGLADEARRSKAALSWVGSPRAGRVVVAAGATVAIGLSALLAQSRGGAVSLLAGAFVLVALRLYVRRKTAPGGRRWFLGALVLVAVGAGAVAALPPDARARLGTLAGMDRDNSGQFRLGVWSDTLRLVARSPLVGHGFGAYADALPPHKTGRGYVAVEHAESDVLELVAEAGLVGLLLATIGLGGAARVVARGLSQQTDRLRRGLGLGAAAGASALLVHSAFDFNLRIPSNALLFVFLCALGLAAAGTPGDPPSRRPLGAIAVALGLALAITTPAAPTSPLPIEARAFAVKGGRPVTPLRVAQATHALTAHLRGRPAHAEAWLFLAWLQSAAGAQDDAAALAGHAARLDPQRAAIASEAARIQAGPR